MENKIKLNRDNSERTDEIEQQIEIYKTIIDIITSLINRQELKLKFIESQIKMNYGKNDDVYISINLIKLDLTKINIDELKRCLILYNNYLLREQGYLDNALNPNKRFKPN